MKKIKNISSIIKNNYKTNGAFPTVMLIITAIIYGIISGTVISHIETRTALHLHFSTADYNRAMTDAFDSLLSVPGLFSGTAIILSMFSAFISTVVLYSYERSQNGCDFTLSLPVTRGEMLVANSLTSLLYFLESLIPSVILANIIALANASYKPYSFLQMIAKELPALGFVLLFFLLMLSVSTLSTVMTGTVISNIIVYLTFNFYPILLLVITGGANGELVSGKLFDMIEHSRILYDLVPVARFFISGENNYSIAEIAVYIAVTLLIFAFSYLLIKNKKSEKSQNSITFGSLRYIIQHLLMLALGIGFGIIISAIVDMEIWYVIGTLIGIFLSYIFLNMIFEKSFSGIFKKPQHLLIAIVAALIFNIFFVLDVCGIYKEPHPSKGRIADASLYISSYNEYYDYSAEIIVPANEITDEDKADIMELYNLIYEKNGGDSIKYDYVNEDEVTLYHLSLTLSCIRDFSKYHAYISYDKDDKDINDIINRLSTRHKLYEHENKYDIPVPETAAE